MRGGGTRGTQVGYTEQQGRSVSWGRYSGSGAKAGGATDDVNEGEAVAASRERNTAGNQAGGKGAGRITAAKQFRASSTPEGRHEAAGRDQGYTLEGEGRTTALSPLPRPT